MAITPFNVIQGHRFWYQSKAHMDFLLVSDLLLKFWDTLHISVTGETSSLARIDHKRR